MMTTKPIFDFLRGVRANNNREWFAQHKHEYLAAKTLFENDIVAPMLRSIVAFDDGFRFVTVKDCVYRFYRDTRFSPDKTPYKIHFGAYMTPRGRKNVLAGYYLHLEPDNCFVAVGVYAPQNDVLKALRQAVYENIDEWNEITTNEQFVNYFGTMADYGDGLKKMPLGFPKDFAQPELLKTRHYIFERQLPNAFFEQADWQTQVAQMFEASYPINRFLNFTIEEFLNI